MVSRAERERRKALLRTMRPRSSDAPSPRPVVKVVAIFGVLLATSSVAGLVAGAITAAFAPWPRLPVGAAGVTAVLAFMASGINAFLGESVIDDLVKSVIFGGITALTAAALGLHPVVLTVVLVSATVAPWPNQILAGVRSRC